MLRATVIVLHLCASAQASTPNCPNGCLDDDANALLQANMYAETDEREKQSLASIASPLVHEIKGMALIASQGHNVLMKKTVRDITSLASGLVTMAGTRNLTLVKTISDMVENALLPGLMAAVNDAQVELTKSHQDIVTCNQDAMSNEQAINGNDKVGKDGAQSLHEDCRGIEAVKLLVKQDKCARLASFRSDLSPPKNTRRRRAVIKKTSVEEQIEYYKSARDFFNTNTPILISLDRNCTIASERFASQHERCDVNQTTFELRFCEYRAALLAAGQTATTCYTEKKAAFEDDKTAKESLEDEFEQEYIAMKKIQCYLRVWLETEDVTDIDKTISQKCDVTDIVTEPVELVYPAIPDPYVIDTNPVSIYPGEVGFETQYYTEPTLIYHDVTPCA